MPHQHNFAKRRSCSRFQSLTDIDRPGGGGNGNQGISKERKKFVTFTVDLLSEGEPLGMTLASDTSAETPGPIYISAVTPGIYRMRGPHQSFQRILIGKVDGFSTLNLFL